jgi:hypothetical protein
VTAEQLEADLDDMDLESMSKDDLVAVGRALSRDPAKLKTKGAAIRAIRSIPMNAKMMLVQGAG